MGAWKPHIIELQQVTDPRGNLAVVEHGRGCPFDIRRVFYIYDIPTDATRGGHAHKLMNELIIAVTGTFEVVVTDGVTTEVYTLDRPDKGLLLPAGYWRSLRGFSEGTVGLSLCDTDFDEADYIRDFNHFLRIKGILES